MNQEKAKRKERAAQPYAYPIPSPLPRSDSLVCAFSLVCATSVMTAKDFQKTVIASTRTADSTICTFCDGLIPILVSAHA